MMPSVWPLRPFCFDSEVSDAGLQEVYCKHKDTSGSEWSSQLVSSKADGRANYTIRFTVEKDTLA